MDVTFVFKPGVKHSRGPTITIYHPEIPERKEITLLCNPRNEKETSKELKAFLQYQCGVPVAHATYIESKAIEALAELPQYINLIATNEWNEN